VVLRLLQLHTVKKPELEVSFFLFLLLFFFLHLFIFLLLLFFFLHYNPLWVLAFSEILFHSALPLYWFLRRLIPIICISSSISTIHLFLGLPLVLVPIPAQHRPDHDQQHCYHHAPTVKPEAATAVVAPDDGRENARNMLNCT
jgi:hypothetical protein